MSMGNALQSLLVNPYLRGNRQYISQILNEKYIEHDEIVERLSRGLSTEKDSQAFFKLIADIHEAGYLLCVEQYRSKLEEMGIKVKLVPAGK